MKNLLIKSSALGAILYLLPVYLAAQSTETPPQPVKSTGSPVQFDLRKNKNQATTDTVSNKTKQTAARVEADERKNGKYAGAKDSLGKDGVLYHIYPSRKENDIIPQ